MATDVLFEVALAGGAATRTWEGIAGRLDSACAWESLNPSDFPADLVTLARLGWTENAFNEYCTGAAMGQLVSVLAEANAPLDLLGIASTFPLDEMVHVELCARVAMRLGGGAPIAYDPDHLHLDFDPGLTPLQRANELIVRLCCVGEEFSLPMLAGSLRAATHPVTRAVLTRIVRDEATHGHLGWMYLDWIGATLDRSERARLAAVADDTAGHLEELWARLVTGTRAAGFDAADLNALGWMAPTVYVDLARKTMADAVFGRLRSYGIGTP